MRSCESLHCSLAVIAIGISVASQPVLEGAPVADRAAAVALRAQGVQAGYNLDYDEALAAFRQAIEADPGDPAPHRLIAATTWIRLLFQRGAITVDDYLGEARSDLARDPPPPAMDAFFHEHIDRALALAESRLRESPSSADAHYQVGAAAAFMATYAGTVAGHVLSGFRPARRAYDEHERVMTLDPHRKDAGLVVGMYRYAVSTLSPPWRLLAHLAGFGGGRERGLQLVEEAAGYPSDVQTNARFMLVLMYNREARYADAMRVIEQLQRQYPRNRLLWLEAGGTALRAGRPAEARGWRSRTGSRSLRRTRGRAGSGRKRDGGSLTAPRSSRSRMYSPRSGRSAPRSPLRRATGSAAARTRSLGSSRTSPAIAPARSPSTVSPSGSARRITIRTAPKRRSG